MEADAFHRLMKVLVDSGQSPTVDDAISTFSSYGVVIALGSSVRGSIAQQVIALTAINVAARSFIGNVHFIGCTDIVLDAPGFEGQRLSDFCTWAGVTPSETDIAAAWPVVMIGDNTADPECSLAIRPWACGWRFGLGGDNAGACESLFPPACVAAGALAISEAFSLLRRDNPYAGHRSVAFSLWSMTAAGDDGPAAPTMTSAGAWLIGLGHLGQAYAWTLGFMAPQDAPELLLQDVDVITQSTLSTSVLSSQSDVGKLKTRAVARWLEQRGFRTRLIERRFDATTRVSAEDPAIALFGVDNAAARRCCELAGFRFIVDAGLGDGYRDFRALRVRTFPGSVAASRLWTHDPVGHANLAAPAYQALLTGGQGLCGVTTLSTRAVGAPFVGCYAAALVVAELMRREHGVQPHEVLSVNLRIPTDMECA